MKTTLSPDILHRKPGLCPKGNRSAFTLIELLVVIAIIAILAMRVASGTERRQAAGPGCQMPKQFTSVRAWDENVLERPQRHLSSRINGPVHPKWHNSSNPGKIWDAMTIKTDAEKFVGTLGLVDGHAKLSDFSPTFKNSLTRGLDPGPDFMWFKRGN